MQVPVQESFERRVRMGLFGLLSALQRFEDVLLALALLAGFFGFAL
jgi:hypothetical protein